MESPTRLEVLDQDTLRMTHGNRFGSVDEDIVFTRDADGTVTGIRGSGGMSEEPWAIPDEAPEVAAGLA